MSIYHLPNYHDIQYFFASCIWEAKGRPLNKSAGDYFSLASDFMEEYIAELTLLFDEKYSRGDTHNMVSDFFERYRGYEIFCNKLTKNEEVGKWHR